MLSSTCSKYTFHKRVGSETTFVFDYSHYLGTADGMFHTYPNAGDFRVEVLLSGREFFSLAFLDRLYDRYPFRGVTLISGILIQGTGNRKGIHIISHLLIVHFPGNGLAHEENQAGYGGYDGILDRMAFLLPAVFLFLFITVYRTGNFPLGTVMEQYRLRTLLREFTKALKKFLIGLCQHKTHCLKAQMKDVGQAMNKSVAMLLTHAKAGGMVLLKRIVLQIHKDEEKVLCHIRKRAVLVNTETATVATTFAGHLIFRQIIVMCRLEERKQTGKLGMVHASQGAETLGVIFMVGIIHATKIRAYAINDKSNLH